MTLLSLIENEYEVWMYIIVSIYSSGYDMLVTSKDMATSIIGLHIPL